jgi:hypothetical protein
MGLLYKEQYIRDMNCYILGYEAVFIYLYVVYLRMLYLKLYTVEYDD